MSLLFAGCVSTSQSSVSLPDSGWVASLKQRLAGKPKYTTKIEETPPSREPGAAVFVAYGKLEEKRGNLPKAQSSYQSALKKDQKSVEAIMGLARVNQLAGRIKEAEQGFLKAKEIAPKSPVVLSALAQFYAGQDRLNEAIVLQRTAMQAAPVDKTYRYELARVLTQAGQVDEAMSHFEQTVGIAAAHYNVGLILQERGKLDESEQHFLKATIHAPEMEQAQEWLDVVRREKAQARVLASKPAAETIQRVSGRGQTQRPANAKQVPSGSKLTPEQYLQQKNQGSAGTRLGR